MFIDITFILRYYIAICHLIVFFVSAGNSE